MNLYADLVREFDELGAFASDQLFEQRSRVEKPLDVGDGDARLAAVGSQHHDDALLPARQDVLAEARAEHRDQRRDPALAPAPSHDCVGLSEWGRGSALAGGEFSERPTIGAVHREREQRREKGVPDAPCVLREGRGEELWVVASLDDVHGQDLWPWSCRVSPMSQR